MTSSIAYTFVVLQIRGAQLAVISKPDNERSFVSEVLGAGAGDEKPRPAGVSALAVASFDDYAVCSET